MISKMGSILLVDKYEKISRCLWYGAINALLQGKEMTDQEVLLYLCYKRIEPVLRRLDG